MLAPLPPIATPRRRGGIRAPSQGSSPRRRRMGNPKGNAYGFHGIRPPLPTTDPRPNPMPQPPHPMPGGTPGPVHGAPNPNMLMGQEGHDPIAKQRYWASQGYLLGENDRFRNVGDDALSRYMAGGGANAYTGGRPNPGGGGAPGPGGGPGGPGQAPGGAPGGTPGGGMAGLPLDPFYIQNMRLLEDSLAAQLAGLAPQRALIDANQQLQGSRLTTNEGLDRRDMLEMLASRGAMGGGVERVDRANLGTEYMRARQDLANAGAGQYADLSRMEGDARLQFNQGQIEALMESAARSLADPYAVTPAPGPAPGPGGGGQPGGWSPSWQSSWKPRRRTGAGR